MIGVAYAILRKAKTARATNGPEQEEVVVRNRYQALSNDSEQRIEKADDKMKMNVMDLVKALSRNAVKSN